MNKGKAQRILTEGRIAEYLIILREQEKSAATIQKYGHALGELCKYLQGRPITREQLLTWKQELVRRYAASSVNACLAAVNGFFAHLGWEDLQLKRLRVQPSLFGRKEKELSKAEYFQLIQAAERRKDQRLSLILQTLCATGIRVSELSFITVEAVQQGRAVIANKGKIRTILLPRTLCRLLLGYLRAQKKRSGPVFTTRTGKALDRSNLWRAMKALCESAGVAAGKVFPHNLRHLFARVFYAGAKDIARLADLLGHSNIATTRLYLTESAAACARQLERMGLLFTTE